jgi:O-antigen/teichoic acid export membrane protein
MMVTQIIGIILKFGVQTAFIRQLSQGYLGLNGIFSNVISFLSFADLGIGTAITVALYKPIANQNLSELRVLMRFYKKTYKVIMWVISILGLMFAPFIHLLIKDSAFSPMTVSLWFLIYLVSTVATYFSAYKRSFLMATQQGYLNSLNDFFFKSIQQMLQIIAIWKFHSFVAFLVIQALAAVLSNVQLSHMASRRYPEVFHKLKNANGVLDKDMLQEIKKNVIGAISSKVGAIVVFGTDNLILSAFIGLSAVAKYSNYMLIVQNLNIIFSQVLGSFVASIGNLHATESSRREEGVFFRLMYMSAILNIFVSVGLAFALAAFIKMWAGSSYLLSYMITLFIIINSSVNQSRYIVQNFISGMGLYWSIRWKSIIEAAANLILSLIFVWVFHMGVVSVVAGTLCSNILFNVVWEPYIVFHFGLKLSLRPYFKRFALYQGFSLIAIVAISFLGNHIVGITLPLLTVSAFLVELIVLVIFFAITCRTQEFRYFFQLIRSRLGKAKSK